ncbi:beta-carotene 15,15'-monooxygenase [Streptococcus mitis]|uniref:beta-carotene 15,15'-monooxygenase n=1 Tax=Streptococcus mitis TaxID=28037 RepID=UPI0039C3045D
MYYFNTDNRLRNLFAQTWKILMYALTYFPIISLIIFCLTDFKLVIILQFALILIYVFNYKNRFNKFRVFLTKSTKSLAFMNAWDGIFCGILTYILYNLNLVESTLINLSQYFSTNYGISKNHINNWIIIVILLILPFVLSVIKTIISIKIFKKVNKIDISKGKTLWNVYATMLINSFLWYYIYIYYFISKAIDFHSDLITDIFIFNSFIALYLIFWWIIHNLIRHGAKDTKEVIASWLTGTICILLLAIFNQVENELINALTWFLPILIPSLIGEINSQFDTKKYKKKPIRTEKMDRHLYRTQLYSFLTLLMLSIIPKLTEIIWGLKIKMKLVEFITPVADWMSELFASTIIIFVCFILSLVIGKAIIWLLQYFYLNTHNGYYVYRDNMHSVLINRRYKRNIHKRRKNNV